MAAYKLLRLGAVYGSTAREVVGNGTIVHLLHYSHNGRGKQAQRRKLPCHI